MNFTIKIWALRQVEVECDYEEDGDKVTIVNIGSVINIPFNAMEISQALRQAKQEVKRLKKEAKE